MGTKISIALDGPAGSGKSTIAKLLAGHLKYVYIDTGAMYRAVALKALKQSVSLVNQEQLTKLAEQTAIDLRYRYDESGPILQVLLDGQDVSEAIRSIEISNQVSTVAAVAGVRQALVKLQQQMAQGGGVVMDGRDIGTVVLPKADLKVFLTASVTERGKRRWLELQAKGVKVELQELIQQIERRDYLDSHRDTAPLKQAEDAILLDTTTMSIEAVVTRLRELALERGAVFN